MIIALIWASLEKSTEFTISGGVTQISREWLSLNVPLQSITIPDGVTEISYTELERCTSLAPSF